MKKIILSLLVVCLFASCKTPPPDAANPGAGPKLTVRIPELFSPNPDIVNDTIDISISVSHPVDIKDWSIAIQPKRQPLTPEQLAQLQERAGEQRQRTTSQRQRRVFFEQTGTGTPPTLWKWNGKSTSRVDASGEGEMVQSATAYQFVLSVTDIFGNNTTYDEGVIEVDVIVKKDGNKLRIVVPAITFEGDSSNFSQVVAGRLSESDVNSNRRVLRLISNALNKYPDYKITIEGHANPVIDPATTRGKAEENNLKSFSEQRARAVGVYLSQNHNIAASRFTYVGMGATKTVVGFKEDDEEKWKNRRVEFILDR